MARPLWFVQMIKQTFGNRFLLARLTHVPPLRWGINRLLFYGDKLYYLPKTKVVELNQTLERTEDTVLPSASILHFIDKSSKRWIMNSCICRSANDCEDHDKNLGCLFMGDAVDQINPALGRYVSVEEAKAHVKACADNGLVHLIGKNKLDVMWLGAAPGEKLLTICNCCSCCCLWKMIPQLDLQISNKVAKMPGVHVETDHNLCTGCEKCVSSDICFVNAISIHNKKSTIDQDICRGCGRCLEICSRDAISLSVDLPQAVETTIDELSPVVDVS